MNAAVFTVIKDENEEDMVQWVNHHINAGLDVWVFEDYDSKVHKSLYSMAKCHVMRITDVTGIEEIKEFQKKRGDKSRPKHSLQPFYMHKILQYLEGKCSWAGYIDADEFIFADGDISKILEDYSGFQVLVVYGKLFNANGNIKRPSGNITEIYTQQIDNVKFCRTCKMFFNMALYDSGMKFTQHHPLYKCRYCNTRHEETLHNFVYERIYFRHYITKSFEDWNNKMKRGQFNNSKKFEDFFLLNPDIDRQEIL